MNNKLKVLDFGGAAGAHYFIVKSLLDKEISNWRVVETSKMTQEAIKNQLENSELSFYDNLPHREKN